MANKLEPIFRKGLLALVIFILFIVVFEQFLTLPRWLQALGRMHPLVLHFPIVLLLMAAGLQYFARFSRQSVSGDMRQVLRFLWLAGALFAGITVVMGIFLSQEEGYNSDATDWHKWTGVAVFLLASLLYRLQGHAFLESFTGAVLVIGLAILIPVCGHLGAVLTHGDNFITAPLQLEKKRPVVPLEEAYVFDDLVLPILETKCTGCHNPNKIKGKLNLMDSAAILAGGKSGLAINFQQPEDSRLLERIHLPLEAKEHMPPKGKPQLTPDEEAILVAWIKAGAPFSRKVLSLESSDPLQQLAAKQFQAAPTEVSQEVYTFPAAKEADIERLNTDYRTILPVAYGSPALSVQLFSAQAYEARQLEELQPVKTQIVSLDLSKLPVTDADLKLITPFENLRRLNLNFTNITAEGLTPLSKLQHLDQLHLAGVSLKPEAVKALLTAIPSLKAMTLWETGLTRQHMEELSQINPSLHVTGAFSDGDTVLLKLNPPVARTDQWVFPEQTEVTLGHPVSGVRLHYTLDETEPDSLSPVFSTPLTLHTTSVVRVKGYKEGWLPSDVTDFQFYRNTYKPDSVQLLNKLNHVHLAEGAHTFFDTQLGAIGANNPAWANYFAGVRHEAMQLVCRFDDPAEVSSVGIRYMIEEATGIYPPAAVEIWGGDNDQQLKLLAKRTLQAPEKGETPSLRKLDITFPKHPVRCLKIVAQPYKTEHPRLLLIDEMFLN